MPSYIKEKKKIIVSEFSCSCDFVFWTREKTSSFQCPICGQEALLNEEDIEVNVKE